MAQIHLLIADDNASVRGQLRLLVGMEEDREVVGEEEDRWEGRMAKRRYSHLT